MHWSPVANILYIYRRIFLAVPVYIYMREGNSTSSSQCLDLSVVITRPSLCLEWNGDRREGEGAGVALYGNCPIPLHRWVQLFNILNSPL